MRDARKQSILNAAMVEARQHGYANVTRCAIAQRAGCTSSLVPFYFGTMVELKRAIMSEAIRVRDLRVLAQGIADKHPKVKNMPKDLKMEVLAHLMEA